MATFDIFTLILIFLALFSYVNSRWVKLPPIIAFTIGALALAACLLILQWFGLDFVQPLINTIAEINFSDTVLYGILSFLLFAGSLQLNIRRLAEEKWVILTLATVSVILSTFLVGTLMYWGFGALGIEIPYIYALVFGALISPTDPVIVIGLLKAAKIAPKLKVKVMGESLFNDGISIVLFVVLLNLAGFEESIVTTDILLMLGQQLIGSALLGLLCGYVTHAMITSVKGDSVRVMITLGLVAAGYDLATVLGTSGPITVVVMGLVVRNTKSDAQGKFHGLYSFWGLIDEFLNAGLFVLMGLQLLALPFATNYTLAGILAIFVVLLARYVSVLVPISIFRIFRPFQKNVVLFLTWVGLRGGVSLALALSLPDDARSHAIWTATFFVVIFSTIIQGLTFRRFVKRSPATRT